VNVAANVAEQLHELVTPEPPYLLDPDAAIAGGRRRRRVRTTGITAAVGMTAAAVVGTVVALQPPTLVVHDSVTSRSFGSTAPQGEVERLVREHTPAGWTLANVHETASDGFQADVDDGDGASRLYVGISPSPGTLQQHPCRDEEFALGGLCREVDLDAGTRLITRGPTASGPVTSSYALIVHRDGSGVDVGNDNATWPWVDVAPGTRITPQDKLLLNTPSVNRSLPVYSLAQLVDLAKAVDAATSGR
jgi:hypothetical protein